MVGAGGGARTATMGVFTAGIAFEDLGMFVLVRESVVRVSVGMSLTGAEGGT